MSVDAPLEIPPELAALSALVQTEQDTFALGNERIREAALEAAKYVFDLALKSESQSRTHVASLLSTLSPAEAPQTRSQARANGKRKRSPSPSSRRAQGFELTPLSNLFVKGMDDEQIWAQLDLRSKNICDVLDHALDGGEAGEEEDSEEDAMPGMQATDSEDGLELDGMDVDGADALDEIEDDETFGEEGMLDGVEDDDDEDAEDEDEDDYGSDAAHDLGEGTTVLRDPSSDEDEDEGEDEDLDGGASSTMLDALRGRRPGRRKGGHPELDDGFFDLDAFNAETEAAEAKKASRGGLGEDEEQDSDNDDEDVDYFASVDNFENFEEEDLEADQGEARYADFFDPPPKIKPPSGKASKPSSSTSSPKKPGQVRFHDEVKVRNIKAKGKNLPLYTMYGEGGDEDEDDDDERGDGEGLDGFGEIMSFDGEEADGLVALQDEEEEEDLDENEDEEDASESFDGDADNSADGDEVASMRGRKAIDRFKDDLFAEDDSNEPDLTTHEKRMAALKEQITALESENVSQKHWALMGEAQSRSRPQNSLLEEDLEFERVMKAVPVVTEETVQGLEERIKVRILENSFDDVVRIRPLEDKPFLPSRFFELQDTKSSQSLAQIYEDEYAAARNGGVAGDDRDGKLQKEHAEIEKQWESICGKLDALCNAHFTPKQPKATISTMSNVAASSLESALPTAKSASSMLAPEEVFAPGPSDTRARSEMTPAEKQALRNKQRKARKKMRDSLDRSVDKYAKKVRGIGGAKKEKQAALESIVKKGKGVTVIGKKSKDVGGMKSKRSGRT